MGYYSTISINDPTYGGLIFNSSSFSEAYSFFPYASNTLYIQIAPAVSAGYTYDYSKCKTYFKRAVFLITDSTTNTSISNIINVYYGSTLSGTTSKSAIMGGSNIQFGFLIANSGVVGSSSSKPGTLTMITFDSSGAVKINRYLSDRENYSYYKIEGTNVIFTRIA